MADYLDYLGARRVSPVGQGERFKAQGVKGLFSHPAGGSPASGGLFGGGGGGGGTTTPINVDQPDNPFSEINIDEVSKDSISALYDSGEANLGSISNIMQEQRERELAEELEAARAEEAAKQQAIYEAQMEQQRLENEKAMQEQIEQQAAIQAQLDEINNRPVVQPDPVTPEPVVQPDPVVETPSGPLDPGPDNPAAQTDPAAELKPAPIRPQPTPPDTVRPVLPGRPSVVAQPDGTIRPTGDQPLLTDAPPPKPQPKPDPVHVLPSPSDTFVGGSSKPTPAPVAKPPASGPVIRPTINPGGDVGLTIDGKSPGQVLLGTKPGQVITNALPDVLKSGPGTFPMPTGIPTHINTGGPGGFGGTGIGVLAPIGGGRPTVYGTWDASAVADLMKNPARVLRQKGQEFGDGIRDVWGKIKDIFTPDQQAEVEAAIEKDEAPALPEGPKEEAPTLPVASPEKSPVLPYSEGQIIGISNPGYDRASLSNLSTAASMFNLFSALEQNALQRRRWGENVKQKATAKYI